MRHMLMDIFLSVCMGIGLAAACGFRVFVPFLLLSVAALTGHVQLAKGFAWIWDLSRPYYLRSGYCR